MPDSFIQTADPFMESGSAPGLTFPAVGDIRVITVRKVTERVDTEPSGTPKTWPDGTPKNVFVFNGEGADGEPVSLWVRGNMVKAIREATVKAGLASVIDTRVTVKFTEEGTPTQRGFSPPKIYAAKVEKVAAATKPVDAFDDEAPF